MNYYIGYYQLGESKFRLSPYLTLSVLESTSDYIAIRGDIKLMYNTDSRVIIRFRGGQYTVHGLELLDNTSMVKYIVTTEFIENV